MTRHYPDLGSASDWLNQIFHAARPIRSTTQIWVVKRHQYGISTLVSRTSFGGETSGSVAKFRLFSQANNHDTTTVLEPSLGQCTKQTPCYLFTKKQGPALTITPDSVLSTNFAIFKLHIRPRFQSEGK